MHGYHRRRSPLKLALWGGSFLALSLVLAWRFDWLPGGGEAESPLEPNSQTAGDAAASSNKVGIDNGGDALFDPSVFKQQREPDGRDVSMPKNFAPPTGTLPGGFPSHAASGRKTRNASSGIVRNTGRDLTMANNATGRNANPFSGGNRAAANSSSGRSPSRADVEGSSDRLSETRTLDNAAPPASTLQKIDSLIRAGETKAAHKELSQIYWKQPQWRGAIRHRIEQTAKEIFFDNRRHFMKPYEVQPGDQLRTIARQYKLSYQYLERLNGITARQIRPGMKLKVLNGPFHAVVDLKTRELTVHYHGYYVAKYAIGIGKDGKTPIGKHRIDGKLVNPTYTHTDEITGRRTRVPFGNPNNPLGTRWLSIGKSFGIHGTNDPQSIGKAESAGCVRMHNADVEWVYDLLTVGSEVIIQQ